VQCKLAGHIQVFLDEKDTIGRNDLEINDKIRVLVAVVTETFFEKPQQLSCRHPKLYEQFK
jgi:Mlc titration factor MtfA (ptsG expression regulator)